MRPSAERVAREYIGNRFVEPLGALLHARQVGAVRHAIARERAERVLEIAPGPGRLTVDVMPAVERQGARAVLVEASAQMLAEARIRLGDRNAAGSCRATRSICRSVRSSIWSTSSA
jgi:hypothetical protein